MFRRPPGLCPRMVIEQLRTRQIRRFSSEPVGDDVLGQLLEIARWSGSFANSQPWHFIVVRDRDVLRRISQLRPIMSWLADAPPVIAIVLDSAGPGPKYDATGTSQAYDEGRVTERLLVGAHNLGLGGGTCWFGGASEEALAKKILGIPAQRVAPSP